MKFNLDHFKAVTLGAATNDIRHYLNGVRVRGIAGSKEAILEATNGHIAIQYTQQLEEELTQDVDYIISIDTAKEIARVNPGRIGRWEVLLPQELVDQQAENIGYVNRQPVLLSKVPGPFPDIDRVIRNPTVVPHFDGVGFSTKYLALLDRVRAALRIKAGSGFVHLQPTESTPVSYRIGFKDHPHLTIILMTARV